MHRHTRTCVYTHGTSNCVSLEIAGVVKGLSNGQWSHCTDGEAEPSRKGLLEKGLEWNPGAPDHLGLLGQLVKEGQSIPEGGAYSGHLTQSPHPVLLFAKQARGPDGL